MLNIITFAVGVGSVEELAARQAQRARNDPPLRHQTRVTPKRAEEVLAGGSLYWVIGGIARVRQRVRAIRPDTWDDGSACCALELDPELVPVEPRAVKPFQGWRYLEPGEAPLDRAQGFAEAQQGLDAMPAEMRRELAALGLL